MPPLVAQLVGGAGTAKTTELMRIMDKVLEHVYDPHLIGFCSFTRAARAEAAARAADRFDMSVRELEGAGWFRTVHSICYRQLGVGKALLTDNAESRKWMMSALGEEVGGPADSEDHRVFEGRATNASKAMALWSTARNRLEPLKNTWTEARACDDRLPGYNLCKSIIERYEQAKRLDGRCDYTDLLGRFSGWSFNVEGHSRCTPEGEVPDLPVWFFDEQQDASALLDACCKRLISSPVCQWVYLAGDPFQAIYGWAGADARHFLEWPSAKRRVQDKSYRCAAPILECGEGLLRGCTDYFDRHIQPADHDGPPVAVEQLSPQLISSTVRPDESWLVLTRTNLQARALSHMLDQSLIPWTSTQGRGGWDAPVRNTAIQALLAIENWAPIDGGQWQAVLKNIKAKEDGSEPLLLRGTKARFEKMTPAEAAEAYPWVMPDDLGTLGATQAFFEAVQSGRWRSWIAEATPFANAMKKWGREAVNETKVRVGTIHSVKGMEADNVLLLTSLTAQCQRASMMSQKGKDEEARVFYVGVTRARRRLIVANEEVPFKQKVPA